MKGCIFTLIFTLIFASQDEGKDYGKDKGADDEQSILPHTFTRHTAALSAKAPYLTVGQS